MRLFTAIDLPEEVASRLAALLDALRPAAEVRWSRVSNLHITTKFIGDWPADRMEDLVRGLGQVERIGEVRIAIRGLGWFPNPHQPRVFWLGVQAPESLARLAKATDEATTRLGVASEEKAYRAHLTLARLDVRKDPPGSLGAVQRAVAALPEPDCGDFTTREWHLYLSEPGSGGSRYTKLETFSLV